MAVEPIILRIAGRATTKQRPRFDPRTKRTYTPPSNVVAEADVRAVWREAGEPRIGDDCAVALDVTVTVIRPAGHYRKDGSLSADGLRHPVPRTQKPDLDNAIKLIMDALNSRAYRDDVRIAKVTAERRWGEWPETVVTLQAVGHAAGQLGLAAMTLVAAHALCRRRAGAFFSASAAAEPEGNR